MDSFKQFLKEVLLEGVGALAAVAIVIGCMFVFVYTIKLFYQ